MNTLGENVTTLPLPRSLVSAATLQSSSMEQASIQEVSSAIKASVADGRRPGAMPEVVGDSGDLVVVVVILKLAAWLVLFAEGSRGQFGVLAAYEQGLPHYSNRTGQGKQAVLNAGSGSPFERPSPPASFHFGRGVAELKTRSG